MTVTADPHDPKYVDEKDTRDELTRVFDVCHGCRRCLGLCSSFPSMFDMIDRHEDHDAGRLTPAQQDRVVDECFQCKLCALNCPYTPDQSDLEIDFPRLMLRSLAMRRAAGQVPMRTRLTTAVAGRADLLGTLATRVPPLVNRTVGAPAGSLARRVVQATFGISSVRMLPPYARTRFTTWFKRRPELRVPSGKRAAVFPTCLVEYHAPEIGQDLVKVYERNGIECSLARSTRCCGAPLLHSGDIEGFAEVADEVVADLAGTVRAGHDIVVPQPTCGHVLKVDYASHCSPERRPDAELVAASTYDAAEYLMRVHPGSGGLDTEFTGEVPATITYHAPCHLRAQGIGLQSRDLLRLTGATVKVVQRCSGNDGTWGLRRENAASSEHIGVELGTEIERVGGEVVSGDCHLANTAITEQTGIVARHPLQLIARAYGIAPE